MYSATGALRKSREAGSIVPAVMTRNLTHSKTNVWKDHSMNSQFTAATKSKDASGWESWDNLTNISTVIQQRRNNKRVANFAKSDVFTATTFSNAVIFGVTKTMIVQKDHSGVNTAKISHQLTIMWQPPIGEYVNTVQYFVLTSVAKLLNDELSRAISMMIVPLLSSPVTFNMLAVMWGLNVKTC